MINKERALPVKAAPVFFYQPLYRGTDSGQLLGRPNLLMSASLVFPFDAAHQIQDILREGIFSRVVSHGLRKETPQLTPALCVEHQLVVTLHTHRLLPPCGQ